MTRVLKEHGLVIGALGAVALASWLVAGGGNLPLIEEWRLLAAYDGARDYFSTGGSHQALHPLIGIFHLVAYFLSPDSLRGWPIVLAGLIVAKAVVAYALTLTVNRGDRLAAFLTAALFAVYPSDEGTFLFRTVNAHGAVLCALIAIWAFARLWTGTNGWKVWALLMCAGQFVSMMVYDIAIPLFLAAPVLVALIQPRRPTLKLIAGWYFIPLTVLANLLRAMLFKPDGVYQASVFSLGGHPQLQILNGLWRAYGANLWTGWARALISIASASWSGLVVALVVGVMCWAVMAGLQPFSTDAATGRSHASCLVAGIFIIGIGVSPYLVTIYWADTWRVFFLASFGGAMVLSYACASLRLLQGRMGARLASSLGAVVLTVGLVHAGVQHRETATVGSHARRFLGSIAEQVPAFRQPAAVIVINREPVTNYHLRLFFGHGDLVEAIEYMYRDYRNVLGAHVCEQDQSPRDPAARTGCEFGTDRIEIFDTTHRIGSYRYDQVVLFSYSHQEGYRLLPTLPDDFPGIPRTGLYHPDVLIDRSMPVSARARVIAGHAWRDADDDRAAGTLVTSSFERDAEGWRTTAMLHFDRRSRPTVDGLMTMHAETIGMQMAHSEPITLPDSPGPYAASAWVYVRTGAVRFGIEMPGGRSLGATNAHAADRWVRLCVDAGRVPAQFLVRLYVDDDRMPSEFWLDKISISRGTCGP